jgi:hypothetical protein
MVLIGSEGSKLKQGHVLLVLWQLSGEVFSTLLWSLLFGRTSDLISDDKIETGGSPRDLPQP